MGETGNKRKEATILLVEDNLDDEELTIIALRENKVMNDIVVARDGVEALDYLLGSGNHVGRDLDRSPHLVLLDLKLPKIDGLEVLRRLREDARTTLIPVIILTTSNEERDIIDGYNLRANSYIRKPVDFIQFSSAVKQLSTYWLLLNEFPPVGGEVRYGR